MIARLNKRLEEARDGGFTLIELLIVIVILGILAAIVVFAIGSTRGDAVASACKSAFKQVELGAEAVKTKTGKYPVDKVGLVEPSKGAVLKSYPASADYEIDYSAAAVAAADAVVDNPATTEVDETRPAVTAAAAGERMSMNVYALKDDGSRDGASKGTNSAACEAVD